MHIPKVYSIGNHDAIHFDEIGSTNEYAWNLISNNNPNREIVIIAEHQTEGKGQYGRKWEATQGENIIMTAIRTPNRLEAKSAFHLNVLTSLAIIDALHEFSKETFSIKWPNDIYFENKKISGILIKNKIQEGIITHSIIGTGININQEVFDKNLPNPTSLKLITKESYDRSKIISAIISGYDRYFKMINENAIASLYSRYNDKVFGKGEWRKYKADDEIKELKIIKVNEAGTLITENRKGEYVSYNGGLKYVI